MKPFMLLLSNQNTAIILQKTILVFVIFLLLSACGLGKSNSDKTNSQDVVSLADLEIEFSLNGKNRQSVSEDIPVDLLVILTEEIDGLVLKWKQLSGPTVMIEGINSHQVKFNSPAVIEQTELQFQLTISNESEETVIHIISINVVPHEVNLSIDVGENITLTEQSNFTLQASATALDEEKLEIQWTQISGPDVSLSDPNMLTPTFRAPLTKFPTDIVLELKVTHPYSGISTVQKTISVIPHNAPPKTKNNDVQSFGGKTLVTIDPEARDEDGEIISYFWEQISGPSIIIKKPNSSTLTFVTPNVDKNQSVEFLLTITDDEDGVTKSEWPILVLSSNEIPIADAGENLYAFEHSTVELRGSGSDSDGLISSYSWKQIDGVSVELSKTESSTSTFVAPNTKEEITLLFEFSATDDLDATSSDLIQVTVLPASKMFKANAGEDLTVGERSTVMLSGSGSNVNGKITSYLWKQTDGIAVDLDNKWISNPSFVAPETNDTVTLTFKLSLTGIIYGKGELVTDELVVTIIPVNKNPISNAGGDLVVDELSEIIIEGSGSDEDGEIISYEWSQINGGPRVEFLNKNTETAIINTPALDKPATIYLQLKVTDNEGGESIDEIKINIKPNNDPPYVVETFPNNNATINNKYTNVTVTFNEALDPSTINSDNVVMEGVIGRINYDKVNFSIIFTPDQPYTANEKQKLSISNIANTAGIILKDTFEIAFIPIDIDVQINSYTIPNFSSAHVVYQDNGDRLAVWLSGGGKNNTVMGAFNLNDGVGWSEEFIIGVERSDIPVLDDYNADIKVSKCAQGYMVVWQAQKSYYNLFSRFYDGSAWQEIVEHDSSGNGLLSGVNIISSSDTCLLTWEHFGNIYGRIHDIDGWSNVSVLNTETEGNAGGLHSISNSTGYLVSWHRWLDGSQYRNAQFASIYDGSWSPSQRIDNQTGRISNTNIFTRQGNFAFVWAEKAKTFYDLFYKEFSNNVWSEGQLIIGNKNNSSFSLKSNDSNYAVLWQDEQVAETLLLGNIFDGANLISSSDIQNINSNLKLNTIKLASQGGDFFAIWRQQNGDSLDLYNKYYDLYSSKFDGVNWSSPHLLEELPGDVKPHYLNLVTNSDNLRVFWTQRDQNQNSLYYAEKLDLGWSTEKQILTDSGSYKVFSGEETGISWADEVGTYISEVDSTNEKSTINLSTGKFGGSVSYAKSATNVNGDLLVVWVQFEGLFGALYSRIRKGDTWGGIQKLGNRLNATDNTYSSAEKYFSVAEINQGFIVSWWADSKVYAATHDGNNWALTDALDSISTGVPMIETGKNSALVVWKKKEHNFYRIKGKVFSFDTDWSEMFTIANYDNWPMPDDLQISEVNDKYILTWTKENGQALDLYSAYFDGDWTSPKHLNTGNNGVKHPLLVSNEKSHLLGWLEEGILHSRMWIDGAWSTDINQINSAEPILASRFTFASGENTFMAIYNDSNKTYSQVLSNTTWSASEIFSESFLQIEIASNRDNYMVAWYEHASPDSVSVREYNGDWGQNNTFSLDEKVDKLSIVGFNGKYKIMWQNDRNKTALGHNYFDGALWGTPVFEKFNFNYYDAIMIPSSNRAELLRIQEKETPEAVRNLWIETM